MGIAAPGELPDDPVQIRRIAKSVGYPVIIKAAGGGGGRGMRVVHTEAALINAVTMTKAEAGAAFGNPAVYMEKFLQNPRHIEFQVLADKHGNVIHLGERDCSIQRRNQKVVERAPAPYLDEAGRQALCESALALGRAVGYTHAGTVEFLMDADTGRFYFIEVNPRIQVEHTVTEQVTGIDIVKSQIRITEGARIGDADCPVPNQSDIRLNGHALQCRITTEDPENGFTPDYGRITAYRSDTKFPVAPY